MKMRIKALILSLILLFSALTVTGCSKEAKEEEIPDTETESQTAQLQEQDAQQESDITTDAEKTAEASEENKLLSAPYVEMMLNGKFFLHYTSSEIFDGADMESEYKMAYDNKKLYMSITNESFSVTTISDESSVIFIDDASKTYYKTSVLEDVEPEAAEDEEFLTGEDYTFLTSGKNKLGGRELYYEEYSTGHDSLVRYYFDGEKLYAIEGIIDGQSDVMYVIEMTDKVDPSLFKVPADYSEMTFDYGEESYE
jgi:hypothetical protein